ncbi:hypothetical protein, partial [Streptomyces acidiscabies]
SRLAGERGVGRVRLAVPVLERRGSTGPVGRG